MLHLYRRCWRMIHLVSVVAGVLSISWPEAKKEHERQMSDAATQAYLKGV